MNQTPILTKELFINAIEALRIQNYEDKKNSDLVAEAFGAEEFNLYDNSRLQKMIIELLRIFFPKGADGHCEIEHYCYVLNFGKFDSECVLTAEDLYDELTKI